MVRVLSFLKRKLLIAKDSVLMSSVPLTFDQLNRIFPHWRPTQKATPKTQQKNWGTKRIQRKRKKKKGKKKKKKKKKFLVIIVRRGPDSNRRSRRNKISSLAHQTTLPPRHWSLVVVEDRCRFSADKAYSKQCPSGTPLWRNDKATISPRQNIATFKSVAVQGKTGISSMQSCIFLGVGKYVLQNKRIMYKDVAVHPSPHGMMS